MGSAIQSNDHYQVAIVGGGIAGVTLALALEKLGVRYALLEARGSLESDRGAGIGLQPNGMRILDQLGVLDEIEQHTTDLHTWYSFNGDGDMIGRSSAMGKYRERIGYGVNFIDRYKLMQIMTGQLEGKGLVKTSCRVNSIKEEAEYATVETDDGFSLTADVVVGVDGVRSCVRRFINSSCSRGKAPETEGMSASFATVYGMSSPTKGIEEGERFALYRERETLIGFTGKDGVVFWFVFEQLGRTHSLSDSPRYTPEDAQTLCESLAHLQVTPSLKFGDLYNNRTVALKIAVEEGVAKRWNTDRVVIAGDAAHKMTPAGGQGANQAIESVAILVNHYMKALRIFPDGKIPRDILYYILTLYSQERKKQSAVAVQRSKMVCEALFCGPGPAGAMVRDMLKMPDEEWLSRAFMALSEAPVIDDLGLTPRGLLYQKTMKSVRAGAN